MAAKKNITIAGMNTDAWLETQSKSIKHSEEIVKKYEKKIVAFIDLLAMKDLIMKVDRKPGEEKEALEKIEKIKGIVQIETNYLNRDNSDFNLLQISDSFIFTCSESDMLSLIKLLAMIQIRILIECQFQLRGAVTYGDVYVGDDGKEIIGPAYIDAYLLQENNAIYPRIILHNSFLNKISDLYPDATWMLLSLDSEFFIDYLEVFIQLESKKKSDIITNLKREHVFCFLLENYLLYNKINKHSVKQKYGWTIQYFKRKEVWPNDKQYNNR